MVQSTRARLILGINLETNSTAIAGKEAHELVDGIGRSHIEALEIGNEPELYSALPWYHTNAGVKVFGRPPTYDLTDYAQEFGRTARVLPAIPLAGPSTGSTNWIAGLGQLIAADVVIGTNRDWPQEALGTIERRLADAGAIAKTETIETATMVRPADRSKPVAKMAELRGVQAAFPLYCGEVRMAMPPEWRAWDTKLVQSPPLLANDG